VSTRWATAALCLLALSAIFTGGALPAGADVSTAAASTVAAPGAAPELALVSQTQWLTPTAPWFSLALAVAPSAGAAADLRVSVTVYSRIGDGSQLQQATNGTPQKSQLGRISSIPVTANTDNAAGTVASFSATTCLTVLPDESATAPTPAPGTTGACPAGGPTVVLGCTPGTGPCDDVYPVSVALLRNGSSSPLSRFTTFLTYEEPGVAVAPNTGGPLRVGLIVPVQHRAVGSSTAATASRANTESLTALLAAHRNVPATLDVAPTTAADLLLSGGKTGAHALKQLAELTTAPGPDQLLAPSLVPVNLAALVGAGLTTELPLQVARGAQVLRAAALHPTAGPWVEADAAFSSADGANLTAGLHAVGATQLVVGEAALAPTNDQSGLTFAQPFDLSLGRGGNVTAAVADSQLDAGFTAHPLNPVLAANQLLAGLSFIHFENEFEMDPRGVVLVPPSDWHPSAPFVSTLLSGLANTQIVSPVTLAQFLSQVPVGGNGEPSTRHLQSGPGVGRGGITTTASARIITSRAQLNSLTAATAGHPAQMSTLSDGLLGTESASLTPATRSVALTAYDHQWSALLATVSLAVERTVTFTSRTASIPITVLSSAPFNLRVVLSLSSDKFTFPSGSSRALTLDHATTSVRVPARARTSGDRLPVDVTLRTPDGGLTIARTVFTVHSTEISIVGVVLTVLAGLVLLAWWGRTWRRSRQRRPRAH
jgi:hypothetical protein